MTHYVTTTSDKSKTTALLLCIFLGWMGAHYFYVGRIMRGIVSLFTFNLFGIGRIYDIVKVALGGLKDNTGAPLRQ